MMNNDELQERWKSCLSIVCLAMHHVDKAVQVIKDLAEKLTLVIKDLVTKVKHIFSNLDEMLSKYGFKRQEYLWDNVTSCFEEKKQLIYPHGYPPYVHNLKLNKRGYPKPVFRCARSRCL